MDYRSTENGRAEHEADDKEMKGEMKDATEDQDKLVEETNLEIVQLQGLVAELREGLRGALVEMCELRQRDQGLEERLQAHQSDVDNKIVSLKNSLNTFKEELSAVLFQIKDVSSIQRELQKKVKLLKAEHCTENSLSSQNSRKNSKSDVLMVMGEGHTCVPNQSELSVIQHYFTSVSNNGSPHRSTTSTQTSNSEQEGQQQKRGCPSKSPIWTERKNSKEEAEVPGTPPENTKRQSAALELLESERVYVSYLSLLLKVNISFNGSEGLAPKDKRPFPSSLRFLIQQHLELLHTLQERVLKCQWQGIMGDVFMRLTSKESDFLDLYVSYLKELPDCLSVVSMLTSSSMKMAALFEGEIMCDGSRPSLHNLLLQPVQRIPEYLLLLQGLLRQTDAEHPDYYLLLVCVQQFRSFTAQYHHLLQHNQELLLHNRKEMKRSNMKQLLKTVECGMQSNDSPYTSSNAILEHANQVKRSKQRLLEQIQSRCYQDWERGRDREAEPQHYDPECSSPLHPFFSPDPDPRNHKATGLRCIPESEGSEGSLSCQRHLSTRPLELHHHSPVSTALANALGEFLIPREAPAMEGLYEEDGDSLHNASLFDHCSSASSDSSIDIAFVRCPKSSSTSQHTAVAANVPSARGEAYSSGGCQGIGYNKPPNRGGVSPDEAVMLRHRQHRPLQASQRKSKSLNGLQLESTVNSLDSGHFSDHHLGVSLGSHAKLERQGSKGSKGCPTPTRRGASSLGKSHHRVDSDKQSDELRNPLGKEDSTNQWVEEPRWRAGTEENHHTPLSERSRKEKGGFRNSFKKLFKKKSGEEKKDERTGGEKNLENHSNNSDQESPGKTRRLGQLEIDRGTAV